MRVSFIFHDGTKVFKVVQKQDIPLLEHSANFEEGKNNSFSVKQPTSLEALRLYFNKDKEISIYFDLETKVEFLRLASFLAEEFNDEGLPVRFLYSPKEYSAADFLYGGSFLSEECYMDNWMNSIFKMFHLLPEPSQISIGISVSLKVIFRNLTVGLVSEITGMIWQIICGNLRIGICFVDV